MILCAGEALIDMIPGRTAAGEAAFVPRPGGAVFNTAVALGRLGVPVALFTGLSTDLFGRRLAAALREAGVDTAHVRLRARPTTLAFVELAGGQARYHFYDENTAGRMLTPADLPAADLAPEAVFVGGISLAVEPCAEAHAALAEREAGRAVLMIDPNIRPAFVADEPRYRARLARLFARADIVKVSDEDLAWLDPAARGSAARLAALFPAARLVVLTEGAAGARAWRRRGGDALEGPLHVPARRGPVADTIGAGDSFNAGLLAALRRAGALERSRLEALDEAALAAALAFAAEVAAVTVSRPGADPPWAHELPAAG